VHDVNPVAVRADRRNRIAAALLIVSDVEQQPHVPLVGGVQHGGDFVRLLSRTVHVMVVHQRHAEVACALAQLRHQAAESTIVLR
jgi:hypothetical protein